MTMASSCSFSPHPPCSRCRCDSAKIPAIADKPTHLPVFMLCDCPSAHLQLWSGRRRHAATARKEAEGLDEERSTARPVVEGRTRDGWGKRVSVGGNTGS